MLLSRCHGISMVLPKYTRGSYWVWVESLLRVQIKRVSANCDVWAARIETSLCLMAINAPMFSIPGAHTTQLYFARTQMV